jgi:hypothetical protein
MTSITIDNMIKQRLKKANCSLFNGEDIFMHVCAIIPSRTLSDVKNQQYPKRNYWDELIT